MSGTNDTRLKPIAEKWRAFVDRAFGKTPISTVQRTEMERAFYAGAYAMLVGFHRIGDDDISEIRGMELITAWTAEAEKFYSDMLRKHAEKQ